MLLKDPIQFYQCTDGVYRRTAHTASPKAEKYASCYLLPSSNLPSSSPPSYLSPHAGAMGVHSHTDNSFFLWQIAI